MDGWMDRFGSGKIPYFLRCCQVAACLLVDCKNPICFELCEWRKRLEKREKLLTERLGFGCCLFGAMYLTVRALGKIQQRWGKGEAQTAYSLIKKQRYLSISRNIKSHRWGVKWEIWQNRKFPAYSNWFRLIDSSNRALTPTILWKSKTPWWKATFYYASAYALLYRWDGWQPFLSFQHLLRSSRVSIMPATTNVQHLLYTLGQ